MGRANYRKRRRRLKNEPIGETNETAEAAETIEDEETELEKADPQTSVRTGASGSATAILSVAGVLLLVASIGLGLLPLLDVVDVEHPILVAVATLGLTPGTLAILGVVLVVGGATLKRFLSIEGQVEIELEEMSQASGRLDSVFAEIEGFRDRLEAIRSEKVAATLNQIRYEVSALHEKVHREMFPASELRPCLEGIVDKSDEILDGMRKAQSAGSDGEGEQSAAIQDLARRFDGLGEKLATFEAGTGSTGDAISRVAGLVERLDQGVRGLDVKAVEILRLSTELRNTAEPHVAPGPDVRDHAEAASDDCAEPAEATAAAEPDDTVPAPVPELEPAEAGGPAPKRDSNFRSAIERLKNLRG